MPPGVDLDVFTPGDQPAGRRALGIRPDALVFAFVGRIQPLKAPDVLVRGGGRAAAAQARSCADRLVVLIVGGASGSGLERPKRAGRAGGRAGRRRAGAVPAAAARRGSGRRVPGGRRGRGAQPQRVLRAGRAGGAGVWHAGGRGRGRRPAGRGRAPQVRAARAGARAGAVGRTRWPRSALDPRLRADLAQGAVAHARCFSWDRTTDALLEGYAQAAVSFRRSVRELAGAEVAV